MLQGTNTLQHQVGGLGRGSAQQEIAEASVQPRLAARIVPLTVNRFLQHVGVVTAEARDFLLQPISKTYHQIGVALVPKGIPMRQVSLHPRAGGFDDVLTDLLGIKWRQVGVPIDDLRFVARCAHNHTASR
jgi:hypothetical protein